MTCVTRPIGGLEWSFTLAMRSVPRVAILLLKFGWLRFYQPGCGAGLPDGPHGHATEYELVTLHANVLLVCVASIL